MEKQVKTYIKALKKSINQERFLIRVAGLEYEVAQKLPHSTPVQENCGPGSERDSGRCGKRTAVGAELRSKVTPAGSNALMADVFTFCFQGEVSRLV